MSAPKTESGGADLGYVAVRHKTLLTAAVVAAMIMQVLDATIANVALPHMQASLGATPESISWVLTSYIIAGAVTLPALGWLVAQFGVRKVLLVSVVVFTAASALCGLAQNIEQLVLFRMLQGVGGAFLAPLAQTVMLDINKPEDRAKAMGIFAQGVMLGPIAGPLLGGYLTENLSWHWVFFVNLPVGIVAFFVLTATMPRLPAIGRRFDAFGWLLIAVALASMQLLLDRGQSKDWFDSGEIVLWAGLCAASGWMFTIQMATKRDALFPRELVQDRNLMLALAFFFLLGLILFSVMALMPGMLQAIYGYPAIDTGWLLTLRGVGIFVTMAVATRIAHKVEPRVMLAAGLTLIAVSLWLMSGFGPEIPRSLIIITGFVQGLGLGLAYSPINVLAFATLDAKLRTDGASLLNMFRNLGASVGIAISSVLLARSIQINHAEISANVTRNSLPIDLDQLRRVGQTGDMGFTMLDNMVNRQALLIGYINDFYVMGLICAAAIPLVIFLRTPRQPRPEAIRETG